MLATGTRLGHFEIIAPIGSGGMGEVYRARDTKLRREVALKVLPAQVSSDPERFARFEHEARTVAGLSHPNIVVLHAMEEDGGVHFLTMELVEGEALDCHVRAEGLPPARVVELGIAVADALAAAHERGVVHRDLKPANVMLSRDGRVKVLDFGLAKLAETAPSTDLSRAATMAAPISEVGSIVGTVPYMAPEQIRGEAVDTRTDLFALGVMLYELASGRRPFRGHTAADICSAILRDEPEPLSQLRSNMPGDLERIVSRCLEKNPRERFQTALDVANELRRLRKDLERGGTTRAHPASAQVASIAVLPFVNRSASEEDEYFSDGLADELLNVLAKIRGLRVAARTSSFYFKGKETTIAEVGSALKVATVLEGSVRKAGNRVRISVQLVQVSDGYHLWSETYDRTLEDIFAVQDDIARSVVKELRATLLGEAADSDARSAVKAEVSRATRGRASDPEAHQRYLLARHLLDRVTREDTAKSLAHLRWILERDPGFALAWAELARGYAYETARGWTAEGYDRAREAAERALALEPDLADGHLMLGWIQMFHQDWKGAKASYDRALSLAPGSVTVLRRTGGLRASLGRIDEAIELDRQAVEQDPLSAISHHTLGSWLLAAGRFDEAEQAFRKALELAPRMTGTTACLATALSALERNDEALAVVRQEPNEIMRHWALAIVHDAMHHVTEANAELEELIANHADTSAYQIAEVHAARGVIDLAFEWLNRAYAQRDTGLTYLQCSHHLRSLHGDPRWQAFRKAMGFQDTGR
jgi:serine/threonine protein kinase/tetratricopeptide (TPR) repeat protein